MGVTLVIDVAVVVDLLVFETIAGKWDIGMMNDEC
jgi:hypothetical protein